jgi:hypothetical protein
LDAREGNQNGRDIVDDAFAVNREGCTRNREPVAAHQQRPFTFRFILITTSYANPLSICASCGGIPARAVGGTTALHLLTNITNSDGHRANVDAKGLEHEVGLRVNLNVGNGKSGLLRDDVHAALALLLLKTQGNTTNGATGNTLHGVGDVSSNLVAQALGGNNGDLVAKLLVHVEIVTELSVPLLDDGASGFLDCLGANTTLQIQLDKQSTCRAQHNVPCCDFKV